MATIPIATAVCLFTALLGAAVGWKYLEALKRSAPTPQGMKAIPKFFYVGILIILGLLHVTWITIFAVLLYKYLGPAWIAWGTLIPVVMFVLGIVLFAIGVNLVDDNPKDEVGYTETPGLFCLGCALLLMGACNILSGILVLCVRIFL